MQLRWQESAAFLAACQSLWKWENQQKQGRKKEQERIIISRRETARADSLFVSKGEQKSGNPRLTLFRIVPPFANFANLREYPQTELIFLHICGVLLLLILAGMPDLLNPGRDARSASYFQSSATNPPPLACGVLDGRFPA